MSSVDISYDLIAGIFTVLNNNCGCPVYKSIPKPPQTKYVHIFDPIHYEDGTKESFIYAGTIKIEVVDESAMRGDTKAAQTILNTIRGLLKPTKEAVFSIGETLTLIIFTHDIFNTFVEISDDGISRVRLIDSYSFEIN